MRIKKKVVKSINKVVLWDILRTMLYARYTEERLIRLYHQGKIFGGVYTGIGQEAMGAATAWLGGRDDLYAPSIRDITVHLGRGATVLDVFRQYLGRVTGPTKGRDGNVHYGNINKGVFAMISHLGSMISVLVGGVMARRKKGLNTVGFGYIGDGASSTGDFHEAVNFASVFDVPCIFLIEDNKYAYSTPTRFQYRCKNLVERARGYGIEGIKMDGNDAIRLYAKLRNILQDIRERPRPVLVVCETMRMRGHGEHDDASYVPRKLLKNYSKKDPIVLFKKSALGAKVMKQKDISALEEECLEEVNQAYRQALSEPAPSPETLLDGVYANE